MSRVEGPRVVAGWQDNDDHVLRSARRQGEKGRLKKLGVATKASVRNLGNDCAAGKKHKCAAWDNRQAGAARRRGRTLRLGLSGKARVRVLRSNLLPVAEYGASIYGLSDSDIDKLMSMAHRALGPATGRFAFPRLVLTGGLPGCEAATAPVWNWARAVATSRSPLT